MRNLGYLGSSLLSRTHVFFFFLLLFIIFFCVHTPLEWVAKSGAWTSKSYGLFSSQPNKDQSGLLKQDLNTNAVLLEKPLKTALPRVGLGHDTQSFLPPIFVFDPNGTSD